MPRPARTNGGCRPRTRLDPSHFAKPGRVVFSLNCKPEHCLLTSVRADAHKAARRSTRRSLCCVTRAGRNKHIAALSHGGEHAKTIVTPIHDPDQHRYHRASPRKRGAEERHAMNAGTRLITLGTSAGPPPRAHRAQSSNLLIVNDMLYVVDAGDGVARRLAKAGINV